MISGVSERRAYARESGLAADLLTAEFLVSPYSSSHTDDFNDNVFDFGKWPNSYGAVDEVGGRARIPCTSGYAGVATAAIYAFDQVFAQLFPPALNGATTECYLSMLVQSGKQNTAVPGTDIGAYVDRVGGTINFINWAGFFDPNTVTITYDPVAHAWVRMRMLSGQLLWETAPDGLTWTIRRTLESPPAWLINTDMQLFFESHRSDGTSNFAEADYFNVAPVSTVSGTISDTLGGLTAPATGVPTVTGSITDTLGGLTAPATGLRTVAGTVTTTLGALTANATGTRTTPGTISDTLGGLTATAIGVRTTPGTSALTLGSLTAAAAGDVTRLGSIATTLGELTAAAIGTVVPFDPITPRPDLGSTSRPTSGTTARPFAGVTARP